MTTTREAILTYLAAYQLKEGHNGEYTCNSPLRPGSDSGAFTIRFDDDEHGAWYDFPAGEGGSLYELAKRLNIPLPQRQKVENSRRPYQTLEEYADFKGVPVSAFVMASWQEKPVMVHGRLALKFKTRTGFRFRFLDGDYPKFMSEKGYTACWYGLDRAVSIAQKSDLPLVIVNGEPSVVVATYHGLPACAITGGETKNIPPVLLQELKSKWSGKIVIALDCDEAGVKGARKYQQALGSQAIALDLGLEKGGDIADVCKLHGAETSAYLNSCKILFEGEPEVVTTAAPRYISGRDMQANYQKALSGQTSTNLKPILNPLTFLHRYGGLAKYWLPGLLNYWASISGGTKTIGFETAIAELKLQGLYSVIYTPEWVDGADSIMMAAREVQRYGGIRFEETLELLFWQQTREGTAPLSPDQLANAAARSQHAANFKGDAFYLTGKGLSVQKMCEDIDLCCQAETLAGRKPSVLFIDFAQLLWLENDNRQRVWMETAIGLIKDCCSRNGLVGNISSQMNKSPAQDARNGSSFDTSMMQWLSDQQANFVMAFAPKLNGMGQRQYYPSGNQIMRGAILKNSLAHVDKQEFDFGADFNHLQWEEGEAS